MRELGFDVLSAENSVSGVAAWGGELVARCASMALSHLSLSLSLLR